MPHQLAISYYQLAFQLHQIKQIINICFTMMPHKFRVFWILFFLYTAMKVIDARPPADGLDLDYTA